MIFGVGAALHEAMTLDLRFGFYVNHDLAEYHVPVHADIPAVDAAFLPELDNVSNPLKNMQLANWASAARARRSPMPSTMPAVQGFETIRSPWTRCFPASQSRHDVWRSGHGYAKRCAVLDHLDRSGECAGFDEIQSGLRTPRQRLSDVFRSCWWTKRTLIRISTFANRTGCFQQKRI
jgi:hypothetical protein